MESWCSDMYLDKDKILCTLTEDNIIDICTELGSPTYKKLSNNQIAFNTCICHEGGDNPTALVYYPPAESEKYGRFHCFTQGESFDIVELVMRGNRIKGKTLTWYKALYWIGSRTGKLIESEPDEELNKNKISDFDWINPIADLKKKRSRSLSNLPSINENILDIFDYHPYKGWLDENISAEAMGRYEIGVYGLTNQVTIPHRFWKDGSLVGIRGRWLDEKVVKNVGKYTPITIEGKTLSHRLGANLYGLWVNKDEILKRKKIMLVESEKAVLQCYTYFGSKNFTASVCGSNITLTQIKIILNEFKLEEVIVAFDREYEDPNSWAAELYYQRLVKKVAPLVPYCRVYLVLDKKHRIGYKDSPTDYGKETLCELMKEKYLVTMDEVTRVKAGTGGIDNE